MDIGAAFRCYRLIYFCFLSPCGLAYLSSKGILASCSMCPCDEACCYLRKEYSTRRFYRVHANRIVYNTPSIRIPWGVLGCGSWSADQVLTHPFDRGAFGFERVPSGTLDHLCCLWPVYGGTVARHRCQCNGPVWNRLGSDCCMYLASMPVFVILNRMLSLLYGFLFHLFLGGWWCNEW
jgi:hypothetical protein